VEAGPHDARFSVVQDGRASHFEPGDGEALLSWPEVGHFIVAHGTTVTMHLHEGVGDDLARLPLLGPILGTLLRQRGRIVLHASAVSIEGRVAAFLGHKGYGKSTTAAALHAHGHPVVTDDILSVEMGEENTGTVWPGFSRLSMWPDAASAVGQDPSTLAALHERVSKRAVPAREGFAAQRALALDGIYVLGQGDRLECNVLSPREAFVELLRHSYCSGQLGQFSSDALSPLFRQYSRLVETVPVYQLDRPDDLTKLPDIVRVVEQNLNGVPVASLHGC
jgi:uncharacterized Zn-binding protein involved in type VI secretion